MSEDNYHNRISKFIAAGKSNRVIIGGIIAKVNLHKFCDCPNSEPGKIRADIGAHLPDCPIRERLQSGRYTVDTSVTPNKFNDGYSLGVALGQEDC
jgi:hypothetical protein